MTKEFVMQPEAGEIYDIFIHVCNDICNHLS